MNAFVSQAREERVRITTLPNGIRVVTEAMPHLATASVGIWIGAGTRHEDAAEQGLAHMLEHMAFKALLWSADALSVNLSHASSQGSRFWSSPAHVGVLAALMSESLRR
jgi:hypothetical protein